MTTIELPKIAVEQLLNKYLKAEQTKTEFNEAAALVLSGVGVTVGPEVHLDLDAGTVSYPDAE